MFAPLIQMSIKNIVNIDKRFTSSVEALLKSIDNICESTNIQNNINKRNNLVKILNKFSGILNVLNKIVSILEPILEVISILIEVFKNLPIPNAYTTAGLVLMLSDLLDKAKDLINKMKFIVQQIKLLINKMLDIIKRLKSLLYLLDGKIVNCAAKHNVTQQQLEKMLSPLAIQSNINQTLTDNLYKGFRFAIKVDTNNTSIYTKRYAEAIDKNNVVMLKSESSFTSEPNNLIEELKFKIDSENLKA